MKDFDSIQDRLPKRYTQFTIKNDRGEVYMNQLNDT